MPCTVCGVRSASRAMSAPDAPAASRGFTTIYAPLELWLGWQRGLQVALGLVLLAAAWGFVALVGRVSAVAAANVPLLCVVDIAMKGFPAHATTERAQTSRRRT